MGFGVWGNRLILADRIFLYDFFPSPGCAGIRQRIPRDVFTEKLGLKPRPSRTTFRECSDKFANNIRLGSTILFGIFLKHIHLSL
jgi:hypothetical protein